MGVQLSDDIGEWVMDGVLVCQLVNHLHPGIITTLLNLLLYLYTTCKHD